MLPILILKISILAQSRQLRWATRRKSKQGAPAEGVEIRIRDKPAEKARITAKLQALNSEIAPMLAQEDTRRLPTDPRKKKEVLRKRIYMTSELKQM